ncbi:TPA: hypothetical protein N0F65_003279 [Lagenidium giganteum]|uniref:Nucleotide-diphospho-sugar transferase n=1 Tax=Lagenidium giganteum TaxID=4803 RepID=A0AAV2YS68_9STRA|nr:TPA: hypothetical protein N0F65_003279 [Lagenidium giganteum]
MKRSASFTPIQLTATTVIEVAHGSRSALRHRDSSDRRRPSSSLWFVAIASILVVCAFYTATLSALVAHYPASTSTMRRRLGQQTFPHMDTAPVPAPAPVLSTMVETPASSVPAPAMPVATDTEEEEEDEQLPLTTSTVLAPSLPTTTSPTPTPTFSTPAPSQVASAPSNAQALDEIAQYECVGWRQTSDCSPDGAPVPALDQDCHTAISAGASGYCELRHRETGETKRVMQMQCSSLHRDGSFRCDMFARIMSVPLLSAEYVHDASFSFERAQHDLRLENPETESASALTPTQPQLTFDRAIVMVVYEPVLISAFASVRSLRRMGCTLPVEIWFRTSEVSASHPLLQALVADGRVFLREIRDSRAQGFYTKLHAVFHSAFDRVLLLDADNFAVRDPTYLFDAAEFQATGAVFWPDYWRATDSLFNIHGDSFLWQYFGLPFVDMFEQESGQVLIDRRRHLDALNVLMFYGFTEPRLHDELHLVWGDKDLFRFAWMKSNSTFHMIQRPAGAAGMYDAEHDQFCGVTVVQHDPHGEIVFLHRNAQKLTAASSRFMWTHVQEFKPTARFEDHSANAIADVEGFAGLPVCYGKATDYDEFFTIQEIASFPFHDLEATLFELVKDSLTITGAAQDQQP